MTSHKPLGAGEIEELKALHSRADVAFSHGDEASELQAIGQILEYLPRLLSMLTPPPEAEVREAVEQVEYDLNKASYGGCVGPTDEWSFFVWSVRTLLRAVQSPRLTEEQREAILDADHTLDLLCNGKSEAAAILRAAFPEAFEVGEVEREG
jgi:hypothetical protein